MQITHQLFCELSPSLLGSHLGCVLAIGSTIHPALTAISSLGCIFSALSDVTSPKKQLISTLRTTVFSIFDMATSITCSQIGYTLLVGTFSFASINPISLKIAVIGLYLKYATKSIETHSFFADESYKMIVSCFVGFFSASWQIIEHRDKALEAHRILVNESRLDCFLNDAEALVKKYGLPSPKHLIDRKFYYELVWSIEEGIPSSLKQKIPNTYAYIEKLKQTLTFLVVPSTEWVKPLFNPEAIKPCFELATNLAMIVATISNCLTKTIQQFISYVKEPLAFFITALNVVLVDLSIIALSIAFESLSLMESITISLIFMVMWIITLIDALMRLNAVAEHA